MITSQRSFPPRLPSLAESLCSHFDARCTSLIVICSADLARWVFALLPGSPVLYAMQSNSARGVSVNRVACAIIAALTNKQTRRRSGNEKIRARRIRQTSEHASGTSRASVPRSPHLTHKQHYSLHGAILLLMF